MKGLVSLNGTDYLFEKMDDAVNFLKAYAKCECRAYGWKDTRIASKPHEISLSSFSGEIVPPCTKCESPYNDVVKDGLCQSCLDKAGEADDE